MPLESAFHGCLGGNTVALPSCLPRLQAEDEAVAFKGNVPAATPEAVAQHVGVIAIQNAHAASSRHAVDAAVRVECTHLLAPRSRIRPHGRIGLRREDKRAVVVARPAGLIHALDGHLAVAAVDERQADPFAPGPLAGLGLGKEPQAVSDRAVRHHRGKSADAGQLVMSCLSLGGAVDDGAQVSLLRMEAPE